LKYTTQESGQRMEVLLQRSGALLMAGNWKDALSDAEKVLHIDPENIHAIVNKCMALKKLGREKAARSILQDFLPKIEKEHERASAFAVLDDKEKMLKELKAAINKSSVVRVDAKFDPEFTDYREDPDFHKLVYEAKE